MPKLSNNNSRLFKQVKMSPSFKSANLLLKLSLHYNKTISSKMINSENEWRK